MQAWFNTIQTAVDNRFDDMVSVRRHLHAHPELSGHEHDTSLFLYRKLTESSFGVRIGPESRGVIVDHCDPRDKNPTALLALRADIDALRIQDQKTVEYCSQNPGVMHACGHDAHTAICLGTLLAIQDLACDDALPWPVHLRGIFQPAEETCAGAKEMIAAGAIESVDAILSLHVDPTRRVGRVGIREGVLTANCDAMSIRITGRGGHAARPHEASDPIAAGAQLINSLYMFVPRRTDSQDAVVLTIGQISGAETQNAIPEWIQLGGSLRTLDREVRRKTIEHILELAEGIGKVSGTTIEVDFGVAAGSVDNSSELVRLVQQAACGVIGAEVIEGIPRPSMGSEDFAFYLEHLPGAMFRLGCTSDNKGGSGLHTPAFDIDEESLRVGAQILAATAVLWCEPEAAKTSYQI